MHWYHFQKKIELAFHWIAVLMPQALCAKIYHLFWQNLNKKQTNKNN